MSVNVVVPGPQDQEKAILIAVKSADFQSLAIQAAENTHFHFLLTQGEASEILTCMATKECLFAIVELAILGKLAKCFFETAKHTHPPTTLILLARSQKEALDAGVQIGGCIHHLFTEIPLLEHLEAFLISARDKQSRVGSKETRK